MTRRILSDRDALQYIREALEHVGIGRYDAFELLDLPNILEQYDKVDELCQEDADYIMNMIMTDYEKFQQYALARQN